MATTATRRIVESLGGRKALGRKISDWEDLRKCVREGLPYASLEAVKDKLRLDKSQTAVLLHLPERTLARRKRARKLEADESDRLFRLARIDALATQALGDEEKAANWLHRHNRALGNRAPLELLDTDVGTRQVEDLLGRIEHGLIS